MSRRDALLERLDELRVLRPVDSETGRCLLELDDAADPAIGLLAATASLAVSQGHSCLPLDRLGDVLAETAPEGLRLPALPERGVLDAALRDSRWASPAADPAGLPLLYDAGRVWLGRYFHYERQAAQVLRALAQRASGTPDAAHLRGLLQPFFELHAGEDDWQAVAALTGLVSPLTVIIGGPGTGKTTTVLWLLAARIADRIAHGEAMPRIRLAAPTGKAAVRLGESLRERVAGLPVDDTLRAAIPLEASTLHRLLGVRHGSTRFRHHAGHPLDADLVVVDEVSMVDLPLMARLLDALRPDARLVLLGDRDQLASVEAGNVLAAICAAAGGGAVSPARAKLVADVTGTAIESAPDVSPFADTVVGLRRSHRFGVDSGLARLAALIRDGDGAAVREGLEAREFSGVEWDPDAAARPAAALVEHHLDAFAVLARHTDPATALAQSNAVRILTALREGPFGSRMLNAVLEHALRQRLGIDAAQVWYPGRLVLVTRNDYGTALFNGDIGIVLPDGDGVPCAWFPATDGGVRRVAVAALPEHESAYAMTIHKSQGSEFDAVTLVLPPNDARVLGRELLYTGVTRARRSVTLIAGMEAVLRTVGRSTRRYSGLADMLVPGAGS